jgi:hypothetical protein
LNRNWGECGSTIQDEPDRTATVSYEVLYIGWDVGGWEGTRDGLAALRWSRGERLECCAETRCVRLSAELTHEFGVGDLLTICGVKQPHDRVVIGIDAPLGWPAGFARLVRAGLRNDEPYLPDDGGEIENRLAYRFTDRVVHGRCGKKPLSASFDRLGNNATKAVTLCQLLRRNSGAVIVPQREDDGLAVAICEAYPALWKTGRRKGADLLPAAARALMGLHMPPPGSDEADAVLCALTAACYDNQPRRLGLRLPELWLPEDEFAMADAEPGGAQLIRQEGWVYFPKAGIS